MFYKNNIVIILSYIEIKVILKIQIFKKSGINSHEHYM